jgi:BirA family transcriptional regulator, biotin operon repressor / biotin---[acetyl-CoA-carboxylase] ligase
MSSPARPPRNAPHSERLLGLPRLHLRLTDSTNSRARELALAGAPHGTIVTAAEQSAGRGRQGRTWSAPAHSSLLLSVLLHDPPQMLPLAAAVAVAEVVGEAALIKWPNDVVIEQPAPAGAALAKVAGILVEARLQEGWAVLGIGLNVAVRLEDLPAELRPGGSRAAATMARSPDELEPILAQLLDGLERRLAEPAEATLEVWRRRDALFGRRIGWAGGSGIARGLDGAGRLVVEELRGGRTALAAGEVHLQPVE